MYLSFCRRALASFALILTLSLGLCRTALGAGNPRVPEGAKSSGGLHAIIDTDKGPIEVALFATDSPTAVENFRLLAEHGYYDGSAFHRIVRGFMLQGGVPRGQVEMSAWGGRFPDNINPGAQVYRRGYRRGVVAMANRGPNTNTSEFFIMQGSVALPPVYVIFGTVTKGMDVVDALASTPTKAGGAFGSEKSTPLVPPAIRTITIIP